MFHYLINHISINYSTKNTKFIPTFNLNGVSYGFIPNLDEITYGENKDVTSYINEWGNMHKAMAVLFRPTQTKARTTSIIIEEYEGSHRVQQR